MTKFCSAFHKILAFRQNRAHKPEVDPCDLILLQFFFHFDNSENQGPTNALYKTSANISSGSGEKADFSGLAIFSNSGLF